MIQIIMFSSETWSLSVEEKGKIELFEIVCTICTVCRKIRATVRNSLIKERCVSKFSILKRMEQNVLNVERVGEDTIVK